MNEMDAGLTIFTGNFGAGKTETALNYAVRLAEGGALEGQVWGLVVGSQALEAGQSSTSARPLASEGRPPMLIDLDVVTPYFRSREMAEPLRKQGIEVIAPALVGQHLDTPAITPQILGAVQQLDRPVVLDVGGDRQGARALGQYSSAIRQRRHVMHFVVNPYRPFTDTSSGLARSIVEIESSSRLRITSLVSNPNLMSETTERTILEGHARVEVYARELGLPIAFVCVEQHRAAQLGTDHAGHRPFLQPVLPLERSFAMVWE